MRLNGYYATESELIAIIRRLDIDADSKITFNEFIDSMRPQVVSDESSALYSSSIGKSPSRYEEEKRSPLRSSGIEKSPYRESRGAGGFAESQTSFLSVPG